METQGPSSLAHEHEDLMDKLSFARSRRGRVGEAAESLASALSIHMQHEENALLILSAAEDIAQSAWPLNTRELVERASALERDLKQMHREHDLIATLSRALRQAAEREGEEEVIRFCDDLANHADLEEQVLYPLAVVAGRYLLLREQSAPPEAARRP